VYLLIQDVSNSVVELGATDRRHWMLGRHPACDLVLDDPGISRFHATIFYAGSELFVVDHSTNGTHVPHDQEDLDHIMGRSLPLGTPAAPSGSDTQVIEPYERVQEVGDLGPEDLHKSVVELRIAESLTRLSRMAGYEANRPTSPETARPILDMIYSETECLNLAGMGRHLQAGASIVLVGRRRHLYSIHGDQPE
jgi:hypothetical protein